MSEVTEKGLREHPNGEAAILLVQDARTANVIRVDPGQAVLLAWMIAEAFPAPASPVEGLAYAGDPFAIPAERLLAISGAEFFPGVDQPLKAEWIAMARELLRLRPALDRLHAAVDSNMGWPDQRRRVEEALKAAHRILYPDSKRYESSE